MISSERIGQMLILGFRGTVLHVDDAIVKAILARQVGGVILFASNILSPLQLQQLTGSLRGYAEQAGLTSFLIGLDYEGGTVERLNEAMGFPKTLSAAHIGLLSHQQALDCAEQMAITLHSGGINLNFSPVLDVNVNPSNPIIGKRERSFSSDPNIVAEYAGIFSDVYQHYGIIPVFKHFPGHGSSTGDTHVGFVDVTATWKEDELYPYRQLLPKSGNAMVMTAHVVHRGLDPDGYPASLSAAITRGLLRDQLKFNGVVVTDDLQMRAITDNYDLKTAVTLAVKAGADKLIFGNQLTSTLQDPQQVIDIIASILSK